MQRKTQLDAMLGDSQRYEAKRNEVEVWLARMETRLEKMQAVGHTADVLEAQLREQKVRWNFPRLLAPTAPHWPARGGRHFIWPLFSRASARSLGTSLAPLSASRSYQCNLMRPVDPPRNVPRRSFISALRIRSYSRGPYPSMRVYAVLRVSYSSNRARRSALAESGERDLPLFPGTSLLLSPRRAARF